MATVSKGRTFVSGETVTPAKLNDLVDLATVTSIVDADISASAAIASSKLSTAAQQALIPAGAVMPFAMNSAPSGWLAADGTAVSRSTYAALFAAIGTTHGSGDGSTTFNLPDLRGIFVRGSGSQTISGTTYSGTFAQRLRDQMQKITGSFRVDSRANNNSMVSVAAGAVSISDLATADGAQGLTSAGPQRLVSFDSANSPDARVSSTTDGETRPANIALLYCIKF